MGVNLQDLVGGNVAEGVARIIRLFKVDPNLKLQQQSELDKIQAEMTAKVAENAQAQALAEIQGATGIITAEANSQSWLPRNVRPLLLLLWGLIITLNFTVPIIARFWIPGFQPLALDPWVYKLTAIGFTGYVGARTWEKISGGSNN